MSTTDVAVPATYRREWALFADWCTAHDLAALPTTPVTVARFLEFEPHLSRTTLRRRVTAINHTHQTAGHTPPGTATAIRNLLSVRDRHHARARARDVIQSLPVSGWPAGMFGRRDALIMTLVCLHGLPLADTATLTCGDITVDPDTATMSIGPGHGIAVPATTDPFGLFQVWRRWTRLRDRMLTHPSPTVWKPLLHNATPVAVGDGPHEPITFHGQVPAPVRPTAALFPALDPWGQPRTTDSAPMSVRAISHAFAVHLTSSSPPARVRPRPDPTADRATSATMRSSMVDEPTLARPALDGVARRRAALAELDALDELFTDIDYRTIRLLARTAELLDACEFWRVSG